MRELLGQVVFTVGAESYRWEEVLLAAIAWGDFAELATEARRGVACQRRLEDLGEELDPERLASAAEAFRYARDLLTAEETEAWLERSGLTVESWMGHLERSLLRERWRHELDAIEVEHAVTREELAAAIRVDAVCGGHLVRFARKLAGRVATGAWARERESNRSPGASPGPTGLEPGDQPGLEPGVPERGVALPADLLDLAGLGDDWCRSRLSALRRLQSAFVAFSEAALTESALRAAIDDHRLGWIRITCHLVTLPDEQSAREAAQCVREDGEPLAAVAATAGVSLDEVELYLDETDVPLRDALLSGRAGDLIGPLARGDQFVLVHVHTKLLPRETDPAIRSRAQDDVTRRAVAREIDLRVRWHVTL